MNLTDYGFSQTHEWVVVKNGLAYVGISDHAQQEITDVVSVDLPAAGTKVRAGDELLLVDSVKSSFSIYAPVSGVVAKVNEDLADHPELVNESPYEDGWLVALEPSDPSEVDDLMTESDYQEFLDSEE